MKKKDYYFEHCFMVDVAQKKVKVKLTPYCKSQFNRLIFSDGGNLEKLTRKRVADCIWRQNHIDLPAEPSNMKYRVYHYEGDKHYYTDDITDGVKSIVTNPYDGQITDGNYKEDDKPSKGYEIAGWVLLIASVLGESTPEEIIPKLKELGETCRLIKNFYKSTRSCLVAQYGLDTWKHDPISEELFNKKIEVMLLQDEEKRKV